LQSFDHENNIESMGGGGGEGKLKKEKRAQKVEKVPRFFCRL